MTSPSLMGTLLFSTAHFCFMWVASAILWRTSSCDWCMSARPRSQSSISPDSNRYEKSPQDCINSFPTELALRADAHSDWSYDCGPCTICAGETTLNLPMSNTWESKPGNANPICELEVTDVERSDSKQR